ncbi:SDR family oxidoreductase [Prolixibacteraceae bacterium JC049]|nr:SDR family oxidoreductase [Prolixibacteraceae bacterium JC049]
MRKTVLITGASSGFGKLSVKRFQKEGWNVIATMRSPEKEKELGQLSNVLVTQLDVTDKNSIKDAVALGTNRFGRIDVLVNNAGYGAFGLLEEASQEEIDNQFNTNLFGVINVTQEVLPVMRRQNAGVIVNITSIGGLVGMPMLSLYSASKFAVEGLSESLSHELKKFNIKVRTVSPGSFATNFSGAHTFNEENKKPDLNEYRERIKENLVSVLKEPPKPFGLGDPQEVADVIYHCATKTKKLRTTVGKDAKTVKFMKRILSDRGLSKMLSGALLPK